MLVVAIACDGRWDSATKDGEGEALVRARVSLRGWSLHSTCAESGSRADPRGPAPKRAEVGVTARISSRRPAKRERPAGAARCLQTRWNRSRALRDEDGPRRAPSPWRRAAASMDDRMQSTSGRGFYEGV